MELGDRRFQAVTADGLLHHLDDRAASGVFELAARVLGEGGRLLTMDPALVPGTSRFARWMIRNDRGGAVREPDEYARIAARSFGEVTVTVERPAWARCRCATRSRCSSAARRSDPTAAPSPVSRSRA